MRRHSFIPVLVITLGLAVSACGGSGHQAFPGGNNAGQPKPGPASGPTTTTATAPTTAPATTTTLSANLWQNLGTPEYTAAQYVVAAAGYAYNQPGGIGGWVVRTQPYDTPAYYAALEQRIQAAAAATAAGVGNTGDVAFWQQVQARQEVLFIDVVEAVKNQAAGTTPTSERILVTYNKTDRTVSDPHPSPVNGGVDDIGVVLVNGKWLVSGTTSSEGG